MEVCTSSPSCPPSADAGNSGNLTATYYANAMLASQTQGSNTMTWTLDPTLGRFATYTQNGITYTNHYSDTSNKPTWTSGSDGSLTRNVTDFNGMLAAEVTASSVTLELPDLHGDIMATADTSTTATGPANTYVYTEFGSSETGIPATYGWLGADQISGNALGGQLLMGARAYNSNAGRFSQVDPIPGGSANAYDYAYQNPLTIFDLSGDCSWWSGCEETAWIAGGIAGTACFVLIKIPNLCAGIGFGAENLVAYLWGNGNATFYGAAWAFIAPIALSYVAVAAFSGVALAMAKIFGWLGCEAAAESARYFAKRVVMNWAGRHGKMSIGAWFRRVF